MFFLHAKPLIKKKKNKQLLDPVLGDDYDLEELDPLIFVLRGDKCSLDQLRE
ncbi:hypothetical protein YC2023_119384 [Brassica napus]